LHSYPSFAALGKLFATLSNGAGSYFVE
jgi:hypothetical protein